LGQAAVPVDFAPSEKSGLAQMCPTFGRRSTGSAWGLDLSDFALKAVKLVKDPKDGIVKAAAAEYILHSSPLSNPEVDLARPEIIDETLRDFATRVGDVKRTAVVAGLTGQRVLGRFFELPPLAAKKVEAAITYEAKHQLPVALDELSWASHTLDPVDAKSADAQLRRIMVCAARESHVRDRLAAFKAAGIAVDHLQSDCVALHNAIVHELWTGQASPGSEAMCLVDVGTSSTNIVISSPTCVWFRTFGQGGATFTSTLVKQFNLTHQQAEQIKREPAKARCYGQVREAMEPTFVQIASEIERSLANYDKLYPDHPVQQIYGLGGGFQAHGLLRHLRFGR
jgi:type IV pilus assembly protein PilM